MVDGPEPPIPAQPVPDLPHQDEDQDDSEEDGDDGQEEYPDPSNESQSKDQTLLHDMAEHPYYFASGFFLLGVMIQASHPFVNWQFIWFMLTQAVLMGVAVFGGVCIGLVAPLYVASLELVVNMWGMVAKRPDRMQLIPTDLYNRTRMEQINRVLNQ